MDKSKIHYFKPKGITGLELFTCDDSDFAFPLHLHETYCIWLNPCGVERYIHNGKSHTLFPGSFGVIYPGEAHSNQAPDANIRKLLTFYLDPKQFQNIVEPSSSDMQSKVKLRTKFYNDLEISRHLVRLSQQLRYSSSTLERQSVFLDVMIKLANRYGEPSVKQISVGHELRRSKQIIELFHDQLAKDFSLDELAFSMNCTPYYLIRFFKKSIGLTPHAYLIQLRLIKAKKLLVDGHSIADVAFQTGFVDQSHLTRYFKTRYGLPPGRYRRQLQVTPCSQK